MNDEMKNFSDLLDEFKIGVESSEDSGKIEVGTALYEYLFFLATEIKHQSDLGNPQCEQAKKEFTDIFNEIQQLKDQG